MPSTLWIHGLGVTSPLGDTAATTAAAVRAGISRRRESERLNTRGDPMITAQVPDAALPPLAAALRSAGLSPRRVRLLRLATHALQEATRALTDTRRVPLLLALPEPHPGLPTLDLDASILDDLQTQTGLRLWHERCALAPPGRAGVLAALPAADALLDDPAVPCVLVGGIDSYLDPDLLDRLDRDHRVSAVGVRDGFAPGEGAAFLLLARARDLHGASALAALAAPGLGHEPGHRYSGAPHRGDGLADAVRDALHGRAPASVRSVHAGFNGEHDGARAWSVAALRSRDLFADDLVIEHPADCLGDLGAAMAPTALALAVLDLTRGLLPGPVLVWCACDGPLRAAVVLDEPWIS